LLWMGPASGAWTFEEEFRRLMNGTSWKEFVDQCNFIPTTFIVDEVQMLYKTSNDFSIPHHGGSAFWDVFKSCQQSGDLRIVVFAVYGYRGAWDSSSANVMDVSPFQIAPDNTWGLEDLRFTDDEYNDYVSRFRRARLGNMGNDDAAALQEYVRNATERHPGLVAYFMNSICQRFGRLKYGETLKFSEIFAYLKSQRFVTAAMQGIRAYTDSESLTPEEKSLCDTVFRAPPDVRQSLTNVTAKRLIKTNMLTEQGGKLDFASPFLRALYLQQRWGCTTSATTAPKDFKSFLIDTFTAMNSRALESSLSVGKDGRLLERMWQMEFYRAATQVLPPDVFISPDVGAHFESRGFLDFYVDDGRDWAIELLRDGDKASEHQKRFEPGGVYSGVMAVCKAWAIIDIRNPHCPAPKKMGGNWVYVRCHPGWESVTMEFGNNEKIPVRLMGGNQDVLDVSGRPV